MIEIPQLEFFRTVANLQHITKAAEELHVSQPNISNVIKRLEESLNVNLFDRRNGRIFLNEYGKVYLSAVNNAFDALEAAEKKIGEMKSMHSTEPLIVTSNMQFFMEELIESYIASHGSDMSVLPIRQGVISMEEIVRGFWNGELDMAIIPYSDHLPNTVEWKPLLSLRVFAVISDTLPIACDQAVALSELSSIPFVCNTVGINHDMTVSFCQQGGFTPQIVYESSNSMSIGRWLEAGRGITFISSYDRITLERSGYHAANVRVLPVVEPALSVEIGIAKQVDKIYDLPKKDFLFYGETYFSQLADTLRQYESQF